MMKNIAKYILAKLCIATAGVLFAASAGAATYTWNFQNTAGLPQTNFSEVSASCTGTGCSGSAATATITLSAYSTAASPTVRNTSPWITGYFNNQGSSGVGITNCVEGGSCPGSGGDISVPEHAIDTFNATDIVVLDAGAGNKMDWTSFMVGWSYEGANSTGASNNNLADIQAWTSGTQTGNVNFNNVCFTGSCTSGVNLASLGFSTNTYNNVASGTNVAIDGNPTPVLAPSRYLILSGNIGQYDDAFKLKTITATKVPEPASLALLALGLLGLGFARRKSTR